MSNLPKSCYYPSVFAQIHSNGTYSICCGSQIPPAGDYENDGRFIEYWNSPKFKNLANGLKHNLKKYNSMWDNNCNFCPHSDFNNQAHDYLKEGKDSQVSSYVEGLKSDNLHSGPVVVIFDIINLCDHKCNFCWWWSYDMLENSTHEDGFVTSKEDYKDWIKEKISFKVFKDTIDDLIEMGGPSEHHSGKYLGGCEEIIVGGSGEPFLHPRIMDMLGYIKKHGFYSITLTNFTNSISEERMDELISMKMDRIIINVSAGTQDTYCRIRKVGIRVWEKLMYNLEYIRNKKEELNSKFPEIIIKNIVNKTNIHDIGKLIDLGIKMKVNQIYLKVIDWSGVYNGENLDISNEQYDEFSPVLVDKLNQYNFKENDWYPGNYKFNYKSDEHNVNLSSDIKGLFNRL
jgi:wyosine [tRNA(Phe)-imidazoG37] synthetase (radical SAM superfamily)